MRTFLVILLLLALVGISAYALRQSEGINNSQCLEKPLPVPAVTAGAALPADYYVVLRKNCCGRQGCLASVDAMEQIKAILAPQRAEKDLETVTNRCPSGTKENQLLSIDSYTWCQKM